MPIAANIPMCNCSSGTIHRRPVSGAVAGDLDVGSFASAAPARRRFANPRSGAIPAAGDQRGSSARFAQRHLSRWRARAYHLSSRCWNGFATGILHGACTARVGFEARIVQTARARRPTQIGLVAAGSGFSSLLPGAARTGCKYPGALPAGTMTTRGRIAARPLQLWTRRQAPAGGFQWRCLDQIGLADAHAHERTIHQAVVAAMRPSRR